MDSNYEHVLVIGTIKDANPAALGKTADTAPEKIMLKFLCTWLLEAVNLATLRVDAGHDMTDGPILSGTVHPLKDYQQRVVVGCIVSLLQRAQLLHVFDQELVILLLRLRIGIDNRPPLAEVDLFAERYTEILGVDFHLPQLVFLYTGFVMRYGDEQKPGS